jgi:ABC-2 type transport system ATP-binding protein
MLKQAQTVTHQSDIVVRLTGVTKTFEQWQRTGKGQNIIKNLLKPDKKVIKALDDISFEVKKGEFVAYAGPNGAGKSTTMKLLSGMLVPGHGEIEVLGLAPHKERIELMSRIGVLFGNRTELWWDHPVESSFEWKRVVWDIPRKQFNRTREMVIELLDIGDLLNTFARELSFGQRMRADLALMLLHSPELILLDEPTLGLDVLAKRQMIGFLKQLNQSERTTIIVTSHDMNDLEEMAQRILLISNGHLAFDGSFDMLRKVVTSLCRIVLTIQGDEIPQLSCGTLLKGNNGIIEYEVDTNLNSIQSVLSEIATIPGVTDIEIKKAPMEQIIADLYSEWKTATS